MTTPTTPTTPTESAWLTATPPTPNGDLHIGHMAGPYVAADVMRRYLAAGGTEVLMTTGMDDSQSYVPAQGLRSGTTGEAVADHYGGRIAAAWRDADVRFDRIIEPRRVAGYADFVQTFFQKLQDGGAIVLRTKPLPFCRTCDRWLYEAYVTGSCPHCGESSNGNACEACARPNHCGDLGDPRCLICGEPAELRDQTRLFLPLEPFTERLQRFWANVSMPPRLRALCQAMLQDGLPEIAVSHPSDWGVQVPASTGFEDQRIFVWFEMAPGYLLEFDPGTARPTSGPVQFFGFDNGYFHAVLFPALFMAWDPELPLPSAFVVNEFYLYEGRKFSTSRRHAVWARDGLAAAGSDAMRWQVLGDRPNGRQTNFEAGDLEQARAHLHRKWNSCLGRLLAAMQVESNGVVPDEQPGGAGWPAMRTRLVRLVEDLRSAYSPDGFDPRRAIALLDEVVSSLDDFGFVHRHEPASRDRRAALAGQLAVACALTAWAAPALPQGSGRLADLLGIRPGGPVDASALVPPTPGFRPAPASEPVFGC